MAHEPPVYEFGLWGGGVEKVRVEEATRKWIEGGGYLNMPIYPGAEAFVGGLCANFDVYVVTARVGTFWGDLSPDIEQKVKQDTSKWLTDHGLTLDRLYFDPNKVDFCLNNDIGILVEDKLSTAIEGSKNGLNTILIDRYWNQSPQQLQIFRAHNYKQALKYLKNLR
jgi:5'(3')-deoxyribonucleotidase